MRAALLWVLTLALIPLSCPAAAQSARLTVEDLRCKGNESTSCRFILGYLYLSAGDRVNEEEIQNAQLRLSWLRIFETVDIHLEKGSRKGNAIVVVEVKEASPITKVVSLGTEAHLSSVSQVLSANVSDYNLLGTGEILGLQVLERIPIAGPTQRENALRLSYLDPQLFDSKRFFLAAGLTQADLHYESENGDLSEARLFGADVSVGRRIADFSYFTAGFQYRPSVDVLTRLRQANGGFDTTIEASHAVVLLGYGWNSSDPIFPTQGSQLRINLAKGLTDTHTDVAYYFRKTWRLGEDGFWKSPFRTRAMFPLATSTRPTGSTVSRRCAKPAGMCRQAPSKEGTQRAERRFRNWNFAPACASISNGSESSTSTPSAQPIGRRGRSLRVLACVALLYLCGSSQSAAAEMTPFVEDGQLGVAVLELPFPPLHQ